MTLKEDIQELKAKVEVDGGYIEELKAQNADDGRKIEELKAEITELKSMNREQPKAVFAQMQRHETHTYKAKDRVYFTTTVANAGNAYDTQHGFFEAPYDGTYLFAVTMCTASGNHVDFFIMQDGNSIDKAISGDVDWYSCTSSTAVTMMKSGSRVWVEIGYVGGGTVASNYGIPSFTGVLLNNYKSP